MQKVQGGERMSKEFSDEKWAAIVLVSMSINILLIGLLIGLFIG